MEPIAAQADGDEGGHLDGRAQGDPDGPAALAELVHLAELFARVVAAKFALSRGCREAYRENQPDALQTAFDGLPDLTTKLAEFHYRYQRLWRHKRKPFGLEVMDLRIGGLRARLDAFRDVVQAYLDGDTETIPKFDLATPDGLHPGDFHTWRRITTRCLGQ